MPSIIFSHTAIGQHGELITVHKIRTMSGSISKDRNASLSLSGLLDPSDSRRITPLGRLLRPIGIDELPQIYNIMILKNMQLIGIRPFLIEEFNLLPKDLQAKLKRHKPGLIPAETFYFYKKGDLGSRTNAIKRYLDDEPKGLRKVYIGIGALIRRWIYYSSR